MSTKLSYAALPKVKLGVWSIKQKIIFKTGYTPTKTWGSGTDLYFEFAEDLTAEEITTIDDIIGHPDAQGPDTDLTVVNNSYIMNDIWVWRDSIAADAGIDFSVWFRSSGTFGSNVMDEIVIIPTDPTHTAQRILTAPQKKDLVAAITDGNRWE